MIGRVLLLSNLKSKRRHFILGNSSFVRENFVLSSDLQSSFLLSSGDDGALTQFT
jgi:hypothetical protein